MHRTPYPLRASASDQGPCSLKLNNNYSMQNSLRKASISDQMVVGQGNIQGEDENQPQHTDVTLSLKKNERHSPSASSGLLSTIT